MTAVSAIIVTRGDVDLAPIIGQDWPDAVDEILVWDNSVETDLAVYGRYAAIERAKNELILIQDDDVVLPPRSIDAILRAWHESRDVAGNDARALWHESPDNLREISAGRHVVCNMPARFRDQPQYERGDHALVGFGACFHRDAPQRAFETYLAHIPCENMHFCRTADIVFTGLTPRVLVDVPYEDLPHAHAENRMWKQPQHIEERMGMLELVRQVRAG